MYIGTISRASGFNPNAAAPLQKGPQDAASAGAAPTKSCGFRRSGFPRV